MDGVTPFIDERDFYRILIKNISQVVQINQMVYNEKGEPVDYIITDINDAVEKHIGLKKEEIIGKRAKEILPNTAMEEFLLFEKVIRTGLAERFEIYDKPLKQWFDVQIISFNYKNKFGIIFENITETKNKEIAERNVILDQKALYQRTKELEEINQQKIDTLESISDCFYALDNEFRFTYVNNAAEELWDLKREELLGRKIHQVFYGLIDISLAKFRQVLREQVPQHYQVFSQVVKKWGAMSIYPTRGGISVYFRDISERKKMEDALKESERTALELVDKLQKSDHNKDTFINMLSHELRNPLASIMMSLQVLEKLIPGDDQASMALDIAKRQGNQLTVLVNDLLDITRINQNKIEFKKETLEINDLVDKAVQDYHSQFIDKNVKLDLKLTEPFFIEGDPSRLTQVIGNLLHNAAKFTRENDLVIVSVVKDTNTNQAIIQVEDTGRGMEAKDQINLFEPLVQVDKSLDRKLGGLGLGLTIVKEIVDLHGGRVEVFSQGRGKGSRFTVGLPL